ncbi:MAG TPA: hypothetical protein DCK99_06435 [Blastocatellia bacterium]|nr:hypothetical protein [Blastocatellia bacterium]
MFPSFPVPVLSFIFEFEFMFWLLRPLLPRRPRRAGAAGVAGSGGVAGVIDGSAGAAGSAGVAGIAARPLRCRARAPRDEPAGVNEQTCVAPGTVVSVNRSPDFLARIDTIMGAVPGCVPLVNSPNCIVTPV